MDPGTVIAVVIQAAEAIDKIKQLFGGKPKVADPVEKIKPYLNAILQGMEVIRQQNIAIYEKVSQLPVVIRGIVAEELNAHALEEKYFELSSLRTMFEQMGAAAKFDVVTSSEFVQLNTNLNYIFQHEPKVGALGPMFAYMDFADIATKQQRDVRKVLSAIVFGREQKMESLERVLIQQFNTHLMAIQLQLKSGHFASSNIETIQSVHQLQYTPAADRQITETYTTTRSEPYHNEDCCRQFYRTIVETHERQVIDSAFSSARAAAVSELELLIKKAIDTEDAIGAIHTELVTLRWYRSHSLSAETAHDIESFIFEPGEEERLEKGLDKALVLPPFLALASTCYGH